jgi:hypothetical protein
MTALDAINRALRMLGITAEGETPSAAQAEDALFTLNSMIGAWEGEGIRLTLPTLELVTTLPVPASHNDAICYSLAMRLAAEYGKPPSPALIETQSRTFNALQAAYVQVPELTIDPSLLRAGRTMWGRW